MLIFTSHNPDDPIGWLWAILVIGLVAAAILAVLAAAAWLIRLRARRDDLHVSDERKATEWNR